MPPFPVDDRKDLGRANFKVQTSQARILVVLAEEECPPLTKAALAEAAGFSPGSGTINSSLNGVPEGSSSGKPRLGLLEMELVYRVELDIDGVMEMVYFITPKGREALRDWMTSNGGLPKMRSKEASTNLRYQGGSDVESGQD